MPNFDHFERILIRFLTGHVLPDEAASEICNLPNEQKVQIVKTKSRNDLSSFLQRCTGALHCRFPSNAEFSSSANNMDGNDIYEHRTNTHIEVKSGPLMTDANCGLKIVSWALNDEESFIKKNMTEGMQERISLFVNGGGDQQIERSKNAQMDALSDFFVRQTQDGIGPRLSHFFKSISKGITKGSEIIESYEGNNFNNFPLKLMCNWEHGLVEYDKAFNIKETILKSHAGKTNTRCEIVVVGERTRVRAQLYPNYKNSHRLSNGSRIPAKYWVKTPCFHVWISAPGN